MADDQRIVELARVFEADFHRLRQQGRRHIRRGGVESLVWDVLQRDGQFFQVSASEGKGGDGGDDERDCEASCVGRDVLLLYSTADSGIPSRKNGIRAATIDR
jgi:hypothetical protein